MNRHTKKYNLDNPTQNLDNGKKWGDETYPRYNESLFEIEFDLMFINGCLEQLQYKKTQQEIKHVIQT